MTDVLTPFASIEDVLHAVLLAEFTQLAEDGHFGIDFEEVETHLPFVAVEKITGQRVKLEDFPVVDVDVFAATRAGAEILAEEIDAFLLGGPHVAVVDGQTLILDQTRTFASPRRLPWANKAVRRVGMTYSFSLRRPRPGVG